MSTVTKQGLLGAASAAAIAAGVALFAGAMVTAGATHELRQRSCDYPPVPAAELTERPVTIGLAVAATLVMLAAVVLALLARRGAGPRAAWVAALLLVLAVLGTLFVAWFGVYATLVDLHFTPDCV